MPSSARRFAYRRLFQKSLSVAENVERAGQLPNLVGHRCILSARMVVVSLEAAREDREVGNGTNECFPFALFAPFAVFARPLGLISNHTLTALILEVA